MHMKNTHHSGFVIWILAIIGLVLALTIMGFFSQNVQRAYGPAPEETKTVFTTAPTVPSPPVAKPEVVCGINIEAPLPDSKVKSPLVVQGYANGCGWEVVDGKLATVQLFTSSDVPITTAIPVSLLGSTTGNTISFFTTLVYPDTPENLSGYLYFVHSGTGLTTKLNVKY
ncbi:MAG: hypothetical protein KBB88_00120 [Candidatus Pacebacteria bacterium]|nr:hypothetical protein [Candidatus Paceibacterota bacterium]